MLPLPHRQRVSPPNGEGPDGRLPVPHDVRRPRSEEQCTSSLLEDECYSCDTKDLVRQVSRAVAGSRSIDPARPDCDANMVLTRGEREASHTGSDLRVRLECREVALRPEAERQAAGAKRPTQRDVELEQSTEGEAGAVLQAHTLEDEDGRVEGELGRRGLGMGRGADGGDEQGDEASDKRLHDTDLFLYR